MRLPLLISLLVLPGMVYAADLVGTEIPPYPAGLDESGGACVGDSLGTEHVCDYSIGTLVNADEETAYIYAGKFLRNDDKGLAYWKVTDALPQSKLAEGHYITYTSCTQDGKPDSTIFAEVTGNKDVEAFKGKDIVWAYRLDLKSEKFVKLDGKGLECVNEEAFAD